MNLTSPEMRILGSESVETLSMMLYWLVLTANLRQSRITGEVSIKFCLSQVW